MANPQLEAILDQLKVLTPEDSELLKAIFGNEHHSEYAGSISALEKDCLREEYFKEYHQLAVLTRYSLSVSEIEQIELELLVTGELKRYDDCCRETKVVPSTESIRHEEKELLGAGKWREYRRIEIYTHVCLSPKELKPFEESLREEQKKLLDEMKIDEYFNKVSETGVELPEAQIRESLRDYLLCGHWTNYLKLGDKTKVKLSQKELNKLKADEKITECQLRDFKRGFNGSAVGNFDYFLASVECLGFMPEPSKIQAVQCQYLIEWVKFKKKDYQSRLNDKAYKASVEATGISISLEQLELLDGLTHYKKR